MDSLDFQVADADKFLQNLDDGMLEFGIDEDVQDFFGQMTPSFMMSEESQTKLDNKNDYARFINETRDAFLSMETGTKTDDDARRALKRLQEVYPKKFTISYKVRDNGKRAWYVKFPLTKEYRKELVKLESEEWVQALENGGDLDE